MENAESRAPSTPMILGIVGGIALAIGSFLNWATVSVDFDKIATAIGIDPADVPADVRAQGTVSVTGWKGGDGKWTLVAGVVVIVAAVLLSMASSRRVVGIVMLVGGVVGGGLALYDATIQKNDAIDNAASTFAGIGLPGELRDYFSISLGIGIWLCVARRGHRHRGRHHGDDEPATGRRDGRRSGGVRPATAGRVRRRVRCRRHVDRDAGVGFHDAGAGFRDAGVEFHDAGVGRVAGDRRHDVGRGVRHAGGRRVEGTGRGLGDRRAGSARSSPDSGARSARSVLTCAPSRSRSGRPIDA